MKRLVLLSFVLMLVLFVTSCFKPPFVVMTLSSDAESKNVVEGTEINFSWTFETADEFSEIKYTLNFNNVGIELTATDYATTLSVGHYEVWVDGFGKLTTESSFRDFQSNKLEFLSEVLMLHLTILRLRMLQIQFWFRGNPLTV